MAGLGDKVLFGFLLSLPFTTRFTQLTHGERGLYLTSLAWPRSRRRYWWGRSLITGSCSAAARRRGWCGSPT